MEKNPDDLVKTFVEIELPNPDSFLIVKETLQRIGIASKHERKLFQSCHILQKRGRYFVLHFKELFLLDGRSTDFTQDDLARRNTIAGLIHEWGLAKVLDLAKIDEPTVPTSHIKIIPFKERNTWVLVEKYTIGQKKS